MQHNTPFYSEEHVSQIPAIMLLMKMGFKYLTPDQAFELRGGRNSSVLLEDVLKKWLDDNNTFDFKGKIHRFDAASLNTAVATVRNLPIQEGYKKANQYFYDLISLGKSFEQNINGNKKDAMMHFVDWMHPENNIFHVTDELSVTRTGRSDTYRPDIVLYINGMPMVVIECKKPSLEGTVRPVEKAINQQIDYQKDDGIRTLYHYSQLLLALTVDENQYATTATPKAFWSVWKEMHATPEAQDRYNLELSALKNSTLSNDARSELFKERYYSVLKQFDNLGSEKQLITRQDEILYSLCYPERLLDMIFNYTAFDEGDRKIARYQQFFAIQRMLERIKSKPNAPNTEGGRRQGGVIWHTQGSGKSLTMVMLAQMIAQAVPQAKILLVTDRIDLDDQITETFRKCERVVEQAKTGTHLAELLAKKGDAIITTIINKFESAIVKIKDPLTSPDIFILIDEGHRSQYGNLNVKMQQAVPNGCFIAFTGTPLLKREKSTALKFGGIIKEAVYTIKDAVADKAVVPLLYEGRMNLIHVNEKPLNTFFNKVAEPLTDYGKADLKRKFSTMRRVNETDAVIYERAIDISEHFEQNFKGIWKGQLVAPSKAAAIKYKRELDSIGKVSSEVVISAPDEREGEDDVFTENQDLVARFWKSEMDKHNKKADEREKNIISRFKKQDEPDIIIVVDKLLTGFDAPRNTVLYLTRPLKEHTLLQAIARVNRVHDDKDFGYIIDYYGDNLSNLDTALALYDTLTEGFDPEDLEGTLTNMRVEIARLPQLHSELWDIFKTILNKYDMEAYAVLLADKSLREPFYEKLSAFARLLKMALSNLEFVTQTPIDVVNRYKRDAKFFLELQVKVKWQYADSIDLRKYETEIQKLIDRHLTTEGEVLTITTPINIFEAERLTEKIEKTASDAAKADRKASQTAKEITLKMEEDPIYYKQLATLIQETIEAYRQNRLSEAEYYNKIKVLEIQFKEDRRDNVPEKLVNNNVGIAFYNQVKTIFESSLSTKNDKTDIAVEAAETIDSVFKSTLFLEGKPIVDWHSKSDIEGRLRTDLGDAIYDLFLNFDLNLDWKDIDVLIEESIKIAKANYN
jgi:type I restriction enzyme, R subunit